MHRPKYNNNYSNWQRKNSSNNNRAWNNQFNRPQFYNKNHQNLEQRSRVFEDVSPYQNRNFSETAPMRTRRAVSVGRETTFRESANPSSPFNKGFDTGNFNQIRRENKHYFKRNVPNYNEGCPPNKEKTSQNPSSLKISNVSPVSFKNSKISPVINKKDNQINTPRLVPEKTSGKSDLEVSSEDTVQNALNESTSPTSFNSVKRKLDSTEETSCVPKRSRITFDNSDYTFTDEVGDNQYNIYHNKQGNMFHNKPGNMFNNKQGNSFHNNQRPTFNNTPYQKKNNGNSFDNRSNNQLTNHYKKYQHKQYVNQGPDVTTPSNRPYINNYPITPSTPLINESSIMKNIQNDSYQNKRKSEGAVVTGGQSSIGEKLTRPQVNNRGNAARTPAQERLNRVMKSLSAPSTPNNQSNLQQISQTQNLSCQSNSLCENLPSPSIQNPHHSLMSPKYQHMNSVSTKKQNSSQIAMSPKGQATSHNPSSYKTENMSSPLSEKINNSRQGEAGASFVHPRSNNSLSSPISRERSNSASSGMSVDSSQSFRFLETSQKLKERSPSFTRTAQPNIEGTNCTRNDNLLDVSQETMEWEPIEALIVKKIEEARQAIDPSQENIEVPATNSLKLTVSGDSTRLVLVLDTNVFLHSIEFVTRARDHYTREYGYPLLYVPWQVVQELDSIKDRCSDNRDLKLRVTKAIRFIQDNLLHRNERIVFQDQETMQRSSDVLKHESPDDRILAACLQLTKLLDTVQHRLVLVSRDVNLRSKALINKVETNSVEEISEIVFKKKAMSQVIKSENEKEKKIQNDLNCMFCFIKDKLFDIMSEVLIDAMKLKMGKIPWQQGVCYKPIWDWIKLFRNYEQHHISFSKLITCSDTREWLPIINDLKLVIMKHETDSKVTFDNLDKLLLGAFVFAKKLNHKNRNVLFNIVETTKSEFKKVKLSYREKHNKIPNSVSNVNHSVSPPLNKPKVEPCESQSSIGLSPSPASTSSTASSSNPTVSSSVEETNNKVFDALKDLYMRSETYRLCVYKFLNMGTQNDYSQIPDFTINDLKTFGTTAMQMCKLRVCLQKIFEDPQKPPALSPSNIFVQECSNALHTLTQESFTPQQLLSALHEPELYEKMTREGLQQFVELCESYEFLAPLVKLRLQL